VRDRAKARNHAPEKEEFRREHARHRRWGLARRHAWKRCRAHGCSRECAELGLHDHVEAVPPLIWPDETTGAQRTSPPAPSHDVAAASDLPPGGRQSSCPPVRAAGARRADQADCRADQAAGAHRAEPATPAEPAHQAEAVAPTGAAHQTGPARHSESRADRTSWAGWRSRVEGTALTGLHPSRGNQATGRHGTVVQVGQRRPRCRHALRARPPPGARPSSDIGRWHPWPGGIVASTGGGRPAQVPPRPTPRVHARVKASPQAKPAARKRGREWPCLIAGAASGTKLFLGWRKGKDKDGHSSVASCEMWRKENCLRQQTNNL
jgi:hypothetical protein